MDSLSLDQIDTFLAQATTNDGLGSELASAELTRTGTLTNTDGTPAVEWMGAFLYERAIVIALEPVNMGRGQTAEMVTREVPLGPTTGDPAVRFANLLDEYRRDGWVQL